MDTDKAQGSIKLYFFIDKAHFPPTIPKNIDDKVLENIDNRNTWYAWTIKTYLFLKSTYDCELVSDLPAQGIIFYFRGSVHLGAKPTKEQFFVSMAGDSTWHPYANINVFQNYYQADIFENGFFIPHWVLNNIIPNLQPFKNKVATITHFGDPVNLDPYFKSNEWFNEIKTLGFKWIDKPNKEWNNYEDIDIIIAVRKFNSKIKFINKPASKLINTWHGGAIPIMGKETAYQAYKLTDNDYLEVDSIEQLKKILLRIKTDTDFVKQILASGHERALEINNDIIKAEWTDFIAEIVFTRAEQWFKAGFFTRIFFIIRRSFIYRSNALVNRFVPGVWLSIK